MSCESLFASLKDCLMQSDCVLKQGHLPSKPGGGNFAKGKGKAKTKPSRFGNKSVARVKSELKSADQIRKTREIAERKRQKNARPGPGSKGRKRR